MVDKGKIFKDVIVKVKGIVIFSGFCVVMYFVGNGGLGVVFVCLSDGFWLLLLVFFVWIGGVGLVYGVDVYDCICVLNM